MVALEHEAVTAAAEVLVQPDELAERRLELSKVLEAEAMEAALDGVGSF